MPSDLMILESLTMNIDDDCMRVIFGFLVFCTISSSRFHDASSATAMTVETHQDLSVLIELGTTDPKTANTVDKQTRLLPLLAFSPGLVQDVPGGWGRAWLDARDRCGLKFGLGIAIMPALGSDGKFLQRSMTSGEATQYLREGLRLGGAEANSVARKSTHSMKSGVLSWAARFDILEDTRRLLGHHVHPTMKSILTYSRDALAGPLAHVWDMFQAIVAKEFDPSDSRIVRIKRKAEALRHDRLKNQPLLPEEITEAEFDAYKFVDLQEFGDLEEKSSA